MFNLFKIFKKKSREELILEKCGCVCYCYNCREPLNDTSHCERVEGDTFRYTCATCLFQSEFDFSYPVPIRIIK